MVTDGHTDTQINAGENIFPRFRGIMNTAVHEISTDVVHRLIDELVHICRMPGGTEAPHVRVYCSLCYCVSARGIPPFFPDHRIIVTRGRVKCRPNNRDTETAKRPLYRPARRIQ